MKNRKTKWLIVAGSLVICVVLVMAIGNSLPKETVPDEPAPVSDNTLQSTAVEPPNVSITPQIVVSTVTPSRVSPNDKVAASITEQKLQPDIIKPVESEPPKTVINIEEPHELPDDPVLTNPSSTPSIPPPSAPPSPTPSQAQGGLPGFGTVTQGGENHVTQLDDMYENGNKIGIMG